MKEFSSLKRDANDRLVIDQDLGDSFDDLFDDLHANPSLAQGPSEPAMLEKDEIERREAEFFRGIVQEVNSRLQASGLWIDTIGLDRIDGQSYRVCLTDRERRPYELSLAISKMTDWAKQYGPNMGREVIESLVVGALNAKAEWFRRMQ